jgi:hypothetical protein
MGDTKAFTSIFNLVDNFTAKYDAIYKRVAAISDAVHPIDFDIGGDVLEKTKEIGKNLTESSAGIYKAANGAGKAAKSAGDGMKSAADGAKGAKSEIEKSTSALDRMHAKFGNMTSTVETLKGKLGAITATLTGGAVAGMAWSKAMDAQSITNSIYRKMERKRINTAELDAFIKAGEGLGYTTSSQRRDIADAVLSRTSLRGTRAQDATESIEKLYFQDRAYWNKKGISGSADLAELLTKKTLSRYDKQLLADMGIKGSSASSRIRSAEKLSKGLTSEDIGAADPMGALQNRMEEFTKKMGKTLIEPMLRVLVVANRIIDVINKIPGAPNLVALAMVLVSASGAASLMISTLGPLIGLMKAQRIVMMANTVAAWAYNAATGTTLVTTNYTTAANLRMAASAVYQATATKAAAVAQWLMNTAMTANPIGIVIVALAALAAVLYYVESKTHIFSNALKKLSDSETGKGVKDFFSGLGGRISGTISWVEKLYDKLKATGLTKILAGAMLGPIGLLGVAATSDDDVREKIWAGMMGLLNWVRTSFPFLSKIHDVMKKVYSIFEWIYSLWQGFWNWIKSAIPGAAKESKRLEMEKQAKREGLAITSSGSIVELDANGNPTKIGAESKASPKLLGLQTQYKNLPGFAEGIAEAVAKGMASVGDTIAAKITDALKGIFPDLSPLTKALEALQKKINEWLGNDKESYGDTPVVETATGKAWEDKSTPGHFRYTFTDAEGKEHTYDGNADDVEKFLGQRPSGFASGATFTRSGRFNADVHAPEEIIPQAIAAKGPGPIARALEAFYGVAANRNGASAAAANRPVEVHVHSSYDFSGMRVGSAVDIDKLMRDIDKRIANGSVEAVKKAIGQGRN